MCGCDECHSVFSYPGMVPLETLPSDGRPNPSALWALVEYIAEVDAADNPKVPEVLVRNSFGRKFIAMFVPARPVVEDE